MMNDPMMMPWSPEMAQQAGNEALEQQNDEGAGDLGQDSEEILSKIDAFKTDHATQLDEFNKFYKMYRSQPTKKRSENQSNTFIPEIFVEDEALATAAHEMVFSEASKALFFDVVGEDGGEDDRVRAMVTKATIAKQIELNDLQSNALPWFRSLILSGNAPVDLCWVLSYRSFWDGIYRVRRPAFDCWDFEPFDLTNFAFDDSQEDIERQEWSARTQHVKAGAAKGMVRNGIWDGGVVDDSLKRGFDRNPYDRERRRLAGYIESASDGKGFTWHKYYGTLESRGDDEIYRADITSDGKFLMKPEINPYAHGEKETLMGKWFSLTGEPFAMGIGHVNHRTQSEINDRRNFINDLLFSSFYNMWLNRSDSGIMLPGNKMKWRPHEVITGDGISDEFLRALRPDMAGLGPAVNLEGQDIEKMRRQSGATTTLQAIASGITATETQAIQSESTRRLRAMVRSNVGSFFRKVLYRAHALNLQFLDRPFSARVTGGDGYEIFGKVSREDQILSPDIRMKLSTDLDFRPMERREMIEAITAIAQLTKAGVSHSGAMVSDALLEELAARFNLDPRKLWKREGLQEMEVNRQMMQPGTQQNAMRQMISESPRAQQVMQTGMPA